MCIFVFATGRAAEWANDQYGCSANLPDSPGWQQVPAPEVPGMTLLLMMQQAQKQAAFGINVLHNLPNTNLRDEGTIRAIEQILRSFTYQPIGRSRVVVNGREWLQFPVTSSNPGQPLTGVIRYTTANNVVYGVTILLGGGRQAAQDPELQAAAASVRIGNVQSVAATGTAPAPAAGTPAPAAEPTAPIAPVAPAPAPSAPAIGVSREEGAPVTIGPVTLTRPQLRMVGYGGAGLIILLILLKIIGAAGGPPAKGR